MKMRYLIAAGIAALAVAGCADDYGGYYHSGGGVSVGYGYDGFYDDYYGPFYDGYWGPDGSFYYSAGRDRPFIRDEGHHFRHDSASGFHHFHGSGRAPDHARP